MTEKKTTTLSVVVPCYNEEDSIAACLDALVSQKDAIYELIVVDNNSTDASRAIIETYCKNHPFITLLTEKRQGLHFTRNRGLDAATGAIFCRIDADTIVGPGWANAFKDYYAQLPDSTIGAASGSTWYYDLPFKKLTSLVSEAIVFGSNRKAGNHYSLYGPNMSFRREVWKKIRTEVCMTGGIMEDMDVGYHVSQAGYLVGYVPAAKAGISGRRMRTSPLKFWKYNRQWWLTYRHHGLHAEARKVRVFAWLSNIGQAFLWFGLLFYSPKTNRFSLLAFRDKQEDRIIP